MEDAFRSFYSTLDPTKFKYFVKGDSFLVYDRDIQLLPPELRSKGNRSVRLDNIEPVVREMLTQRNISVEEYSEDLSLSRSGSPTNYGGFTDICLSDSLSPTLCAVAIVTEAYHLRTTTKAAATLPSSQGACVSSAKPLFLEFSVLVDGRILHTVFADDDLFSRLYSLVSYYNCTEALYTDPVLTRALRQWGLSDTLVSKNNSARATQEMIRAHFKAQFEAEPFVVPDCCLIDIRHYDLVDLGCVSSQGRRLLSQWLRAPLLNQDEIEQRLDLSEFFGRAVRLDLSPFTSCDVRRLCARIESRRILAAELARLHEIVLAAGELSTAIAGACSVVEAKSERDVCSSANSLHSISSLHSLSSCAENDPGNRNEISIGMSGKPAADGSHLSLGSSKASGTFYHYLADDFVRKNTDISFKPSVISLVRSQFLEPLSKLRVALQPLLAEISERIDIPRRRISAASSPAISRYQRERLVLLSEAEKELAFVRHSFPSAKYGDRAFRVPRSAYSPSTFSEKNLVVLAVTKSGVVFLTKNMSRLRDGLDDVEARIRAEELQILNEIREKARSYVGSLEILNYVIALVDVYTAFGTKTRVPAYSRPVFSDCRYAITDFFHPLLEGGECVLNSVCLELRAESKEKAPTVARSSFSSYTVAHSNSSYDKRMMGETENELSENSSSGRKKDAKEECNMSEDDAKASNEKCRSAGRLPRDGYDISNGNSKWDADPYDHGCDQAVGSFCVITGPNMGGKSTVLKALSMVSLYAQIGCYVPARSAVIPLFDRVFMRVGAHDCSSAGFSTFMIEMMDMNAILRTASRRSLVLVDELGRGTSAADGLALAIAMRDHLLCLQPVTFMATHFSELGRDFRVINMRMGISSDGLLTYRLEKGVCDTSFGLEVAERAGFPKEVLENARKYLAEKD